MIPQLTDAERVMLARLLRERASERASQRAPGEPARDPSRPVLASPAQRQLWLADQIGQGGGRYNIPYAARVTGDVRPELVERAIAEIRRRHETLRTTFRLDGDALVCDIAADARLPLEVTDLSGAKPSGEPTPNGVHDAIGDDRLPAAIALATEAAAAPFDLASGPPMRALLYLLAPGDALLVLVIHHIATDAWSASILLAELAAAYAGAQAGTGSLLPEPTVQYPEAIAAQPRPPGQADDDVTYWRGQLTDAPEPAGLHADAIPHASKAKPGARVQVTLPQPVANGVVATAASLGTSVTAVLLAAYAAVLARCTGSDDVTVGTSAANRGTVAAESLIGYFANTLPLRLRLPGHRTLAESVRQAHRVLREATMHQGLPFASIVAECGPARSAADTPFFRAMFVHQARQAEPPQAPGLRVEPVELHNGTAKFDLDLSVTERRDGTVLSLEYDAGRFLPGTASRLLTMIIAVLGQIAGDPGRRLDQADLVPAAERAAITGAWNQTSAPVPDVCLHELFEAWADRAPGQVAVRHERQQHSFAAIEARANQVAHWLRRQGIVPSSRVGICVGRSADLVVGLLGIAKAGGAYLPLDPAYPAERLAFMAGDAGLIALIGHAEALTRVPAWAGPVLRLDADAELLAAEPTARPAPAATPASLAYAIYTSGSTGLPKCILADHRGRVANFTDFNNRFTVGPGDSVLALSSLSFDMCAYDVFGVLGAGGTVVLPDQDRSRDPAHWAELVSGHRITLWHSVPALAELLADQAERNGDSALPLRVVLLGGDWIPVSLPSRLRAVAPGAGVVALGGATEVSMDSTIHLVTDADVAGSAIPYGRPMANQHAYVVDELGGLQPVAVPGELALGGVGVTWGYHGRPGLTAAKFVPNPYSGAAGDRMYLTGDLARWRQDGELLLLGRKDRQVKIRGYRVELGEVETAMASLPGLRHAAVVAPAMPGGGRRLVAFVVPADPRPADGADPRGQLGPADGASQAAGGDLAAELTGLLSQTLPGYLIPASIIALDALPLTPNGKLDRARLTELAARPRQAGYAAPRTPTERQLAELVAALLGTHSLGTHSLGTAGVGVDGVGVDDNFFELGGDSVTAIQLAARAGELGLQVQVADVFEEQTVALLARRAQARADSTDPGAGAGLERGDELRLSAFQLHMLTEHERGGPAGLFVIQSATPLPGSVDPGALAAAWRALQRRHDALRLEPCQADGQWAPGFAGAPASELIVHDWRQLPPGQQERQASDLVAAERATITPGRPLLQLHLLRLSDDLAVLVDLHHYLLYDGWSAVMLNDELLALYLAELTGQPAELPDPVSCRSYLSWLGGQDAGLALRYWRERLAGLAGRSWLSQGSGRSAEPYRKHLVPLRGQLLAELAAAARAGRTTPGSLVLTAWSLLLAAATGSDDLVFGVVSASRPAELPAVESVVGQLVAALPLRVRLDDGLSLADLACQLRQERLDDSAHQLIGPGVAGDLAFGDGAPAFDHLLVLDNYPGGNRPEALAAAELPPAFDANLNQMETAMRVDIALGGGLLAFSYDPACFPRSRVRALADAFQTAIEQVTRDPGRRAGDLRAQLALSLSPDHRQSRSPKEHPS